jgi:hypothetical protein
LQETIQHCSDHGTVALTALHIAQIAAELHGPLTVLLNPFAFQRRKSSKLSVEFRGLELLPSSEPFVQTCPKIRSFVKGKSLRPFRVAQELRNVTLRCFIVRVEGSHQLFISRSFDISTRIRPSCSFYVSLAFLVIIQITSRLAAVAQKDPAGIVTGG